MSPELAVYPARSLKLIGKCGAYAEKGSRAGRLIQAPRGSQRGIFSLFVIFALFAVTLLSSCSTPPAPPTLPMRVGTSINNEAGRIAGFGAKYVQDVKIVPFSFCGITGCVIEIDNRPLLTGAGNVVSK